MITEEIYNSNSKSNKTNESTVVRKFKGEVAKYIEELIHQDNAEDLVYSFKKDEVSSERFYNVLKRLPFIYYGNYRDIVTVCIGSPEKIGNETQNAAIRITVEGGETFYYWMRGINQVLSIDSDIYYGLNNNEVYFDKYELEVVFREAGYIWP